MKSIIVLAGSNKNNLLLAEKFVTEIHQQGAKAQIVNLVELDLPLYSNVTEAKGTPSSIIDCIKLLEKAEGIVLTAPEYNGGIPPVVTNFIAWISRSGQEDWRSCFNGRAAAIGTHSGGGGMQVLNAMRMQLSYLGVNVVGRQIHTHYSKELDPESLKEVVGQLLK